MPHHAHRMRYRRCSIWCFRIAFIIRWTSPLDTSIYFVSFGGILMFKRKEIVNNIVYVDAIRWCRGWFSECAWSVRGGGGGLRAPDRPRCGTRRAALPPLRAESPAGKKTLPHRQSFSRPARRRQFRFRISNLIRDTCLLFNVGLVLSTQKFVHKIKINKNFLKTKIKTTLNNKIFIINKLKCDFGLV